MHLQAHVVQGPEKNTVLNSVAAENRAVSFCRALNICNKRVVY